MCLITLLLRRLAKSNDVEAGISAARRLLMIDEAQERFIRRCFAIDEELQDGKGPSEPVTEELLNQLRAFSLSINSADPA